MVWEQGAALVCILLLENCGWLELHSPGYNLNGAVFFCSRKGSASIQLISVFNGVLQEIRVKQSVDAEEYTLILQQLLIFVGVCSLCWYIWLEVIKTRCKFTACKIYMCCHSWRWLVHLEDCFCHAHTAWLGFVETWDTTLSDVFLFVFCLTDTWTGPQYNLTSKHLWVYVSEPRPHCKPGWLSADRYQLGLHCC